MAARDQARRLPRHRAPGWRLYRLPLFTPGHWFAPFKGPGRLAPPKVDFPPRSCALAGCAQSRAHKVDYAEPKAMHPEHRLGAAVAASGEQLRAHGGGRAWGCDEGGEVGAWRSGGGGGLGRQDTMRQETVRGRAGMPSTARSESFEAVDVHGVARRRSPSEQARRRRRGRAWELHPVRHSGKFPNEPVAPLTPTTLRQLRPGSCISGKSLS
jgi:hypothetical protein